MESVYIILFKIALELTVIVFVTANLISLIFTFIHNKTYDEKKYIIVRKGSNKEVNNLFHLFLDNFILALAVGAITISLVVITLLIAKLIAK